MRLTFTELYRMLIYYRVIEVIEYNTGKSGQKLVEVSKSQQIGVEHYRSRSGININNVDIGATLNWQKLAEISKKEQSIIGVTLI